MLVPLHRGGPATPIKHGPVPAVQPQARRHLAVKRRKEHAVDRTLGLASAALAVAVLAARVFQPARAAGVLREALVRAGPGFVGCFALLVALRPTLVLTCGRELGYHVRFQLLALGLLSPRLLPLPLPLSPLLLLVLPPLPPPPPPPLLLLLLQQLLLPLPLLPLLLCVRGRQDTTFPDGHRCCPRRPRSGH